MDLYYIHTFSVTVLLFQNKRFKKKKRIIENGRKNESFTAGWSIHFKILILLESVLTRGKEASRVRSPQKWSLNSIQLPGLGQNTLAFGERNWTFRKKTLNSSHRQRKDLPVLACGFIHPSLFSDRSWDLTSERTFSHWFPMLAWGLPEPGGGGAFKQSSELREGPQEHDYAQQLPAWFPFLRLAAQAQSPQDKRLPLIPNQRKPKRFFYCG